jgi:acyl-CoA synthetase (NDP forming)
MSEISGIAPARLQAFLRPRSIALVGATDNSRWSVVTFENLKRFEFDGPIYLINPKREIVHGERAFKSVRELPQEVDLAFVMVPTHQVLPVVIEAAEMGIKHFVVLTAGFAEIGAEGAALERDLLDFAWQNDLTILGPNGNGFINITAHITPYGLPITPPLTSGPVGVVLQSGALASAVLTFAQAHAIGLSLLVSMGNESMLSVTDIIDYLLDDEATKVIALFLESIRRPDELRRVAAKARAKGKPVVALKIGRSELSARTALAHTGALVGDDAVNEAAFRQLGIIRVHSLEDLLVTAGLAGYLGRLPGHRMGVVTPSGGACDIISDLAHHYGVELPEFAPETVRGLREILPAFSTVHNPLDVTGYVVVDRTIQRRALEVVVNNASFDFLLYLTSVDGLRELTPELLATTLEQYDLLNAVITASRSPVLLVSNTCMDLTATGHVIVERTGLHFIAGLEHGMRALGHLLWWSEATKTQSQRPATESPPVAPEVSFPRVGNWSESQARTLLEKAGIPVVPGVLATSVEEAIKAARSLGFPVVLKIQSAAILHKSDVGGVALNLENEEAVAQAYHSMLERIKATYPGVALDGMLVMPMRPAGGIELLVGVVRDPVWGPVLTLGLGGIWTEALKDTSIRLLPVGPAEIETMLGELRGAALLRGGRGRPPADLQALSKVIYRISALASALGPGLVALEINPLRVDGAQIEALDALVSWQEE